jgi:hypothetical protein
MKKWLYTYVPRGRRFAIYDVGGQKVAEFDTREEAIREVYRLNGWKFKTQ